jgi:tRNA(Ile)-lysidine synthase TilS/MesJ
MSKHWIRYCQRCVMPETKPDLHIDEQGICSACRSYENRTAVDWDERNRELLAILDRYRSPGGSNYDCMVPVSGGKDSHFQTI